MKYLITILMAFSLFACRSTKPCPDQKVIVKIDTVYAEVNLDALKDSIFLSYKHNVDEMIIENQILNRKIDSMKVTSDTLAARLLHARLMIENARYYLRIVNRIPSQQKFLRGWMNRALEVQ